MAMSGVNTPLIQKALGHKSMAAASIYQRVNNDPVKQGMDLAIKTMHEYAKAAEVAELRKSAKAK
jgi:site-specific recombinase XerD